MKTILKIIFWPVRVAWNTFVFLLRLAALVCTFGVINMMDS